MKFQANSCRQFFTLRFLLWSVTCLLVFYSASLLLSSNDDSQDVFADSDFMAYYSNPLDKEFEEKCGIYGCIDENIDFEDFDNGRKGSRNGQIIVPNLVHLLYLRKNELTFLDLICLYSIYVNHRPTIIYIHCDECQFSGKYWLELQQYTELWRLIIVNKLPKKLSIFGKPTQNIELISGATRLQVLMNYGGIYLDNDVYVVKSLKEYRQYEQTVSWNGPDQPVGSQVIIAHRNSRFLRALYDSYRYNMTDEPNYNLGKFPAKVLNQHPNLDLAHIVKDKFGTHDLADKLYNEKWEDWKQMETIYLAEAKAPKTIDDNNWTNHADKTIGQMIDDVINKM